MFSPVSSPPKTNEPRSVDCAAQLRSKPSSYFSRPRFLLSQHTSYTDSPPLKFSTYGSSPVEARRKKTSNRRTEHHPTIHSCHELSPMHPSQSPKADHSFSLHSASSSHHGRSSFRANEVMPLQLLSSYCGQQLVLDAHFERLCPSYDSRTASLIRCSSPLQRHPRSPETTRHRHLVVGASPLVIGPIQDRLLYHGFGYYQQHISSPNDSFHDHPLLGETDPCSA
mmetsp:Transcript_20570/g.50495  ORF Transcript_20570/g.50495 Transcript_20570/m.50495 type:complete len:225 (+) Transcript_20570:1012-1686(+)